MRVQCTCCGCAGMPCNCDAFAVMFPDGFYYSILGVNINFRLCFNRADAIAFTLILAFPCNNCGNHPVVNAESVQTLCTAMQTPDWILSDLASPHIKFTRLFQSLACNPVGDVSDSKK